MPTTNKDTIPAFIAKADAREATAKARGGTRKKPMNDQPAGSADWEERVYERGPMLPHKGKGGRYRFRGRFLSGYPKGLQAYDDATGWSPCPNVNIGVRIQREDEFFPECVKGNHDWSRFTIPQWNCKRCGGVITHSSPNDKGQS